MKKTLKYLIVILCSIVILLGIFITNEIIAGYNLYNYATSRTNLEYKINELKNRDDFELISNIDKDFLEAIVAIEDHRFYNHKGLDYISIIRATLSNFKSLEIVQGGSTITQQVAKNLYFNGDKKLSRKVAEVFLVNQLEKKYTKDEILEIYVNIINYGYGYIGIKNATEGYFGIEPKEIDLDKATLLAGLPQFPNGYSLKNNYDQAIMRQKQVLQAMNLNSEIVHSNEYYVLGNFEYKI